MMAFEKYMSSIKNERHSFLYVRYVSHDVHVSFRNASN